MFGLEKSKTVRFEESRQETSENPQTYHTGNSFIDKSLFDDASCYDEWNDDWGPVGWHEGWNASYVNSAGSLSLGLER